MRGVIHGKQQFIYEKRNKLMQKLQERKTIPNFFTD